MTKTIPLNIGIGLDDTITADKALFKDLIEVFKKHGHNVYIITMRDQGNYCDTLREFRPLVDAVIFTNQEAKMNHALIDIWIDDWPITITHDYKNGEYVVPEEAKMCGWLK